MSKEDDRYSAQAKAIADIAKIRLSITRPTSKPSVIDIVDNVKLVAGALFNLDRDFSQPDIVLDRAVAILIAFPDYQS